MNIPNTFYIFFSFKEIYVIFEKLKIFIFGIYINIYYLKLYKN